MLHEQQQQQAPAPPPPAAAAAAAILPSAPTNDDDDDDEENGGTTFRDIHPLTPPTRATSWETASHRSLASSEEQFMTMSREFTAMVAAGATITQTNSHDGASNDQQLSSIGEDDMEETNPLAIVPDTHPIATPAARRQQLDLEVVPSPQQQQQPCVVEARQVKKEEVETKVTAWQTAEMAKINNRFKREEVVINGWETEQVDKASAWLKKIQRKLDEQRAKALEKTQNDIAKARRKAEEKRASAEAKRGLKLAKVLELANFMKAVGRVPTKRSFF
ncbi:hypothetical protein PR202_gb10537 [Eleusine coracana subsp. coracana]|uniref:Remorin C-terminal domain-containing protein n=1 Tax=Eleusine coracana subsp. coracana TaxID=191504 RepID=A0AAV5EKQ5_ELECO|nr:hypothetical protein QOZ80_3BG0256590 [Eleusine coracana subsp. coracana]GJN22928.1 hypothetical protein PR202_gb10537 [Eleusine coracana subsp. coracana]